MELHHQKDYQNLLQNETDNVNFLNTNSKGREASEGRKATAQRPHKKREERTLEEILVCSFLFIYNSLEKNNQDRFPISCFKFIAPKNIKIIYKKLLNGKQQLITL